MLRKTPSFFISVLLLVAGCSLYKSQGRDDFESRSNQPGAITRMQMFPETNNGKSSVSRHQLLRNYDSHSRCHLVNSIEFWVKSEFSPDTHELLYASDNLEVWKALSLDTDRTISLSLITKQQMDFEVCKVKFKTEAQSQEFLEEYVKE